ncbi:hypothetical protein I302_102282 [Kwoniella bestiolae CBS 10118]|uniref:Uncharacterized protein n=1 Tax=Kwoniella bestiolae CBS 10118 TaxID=1296100 RepID=A0A1B9GEQ3_9TREE|nr:hypothetical protein I302_00974 [Kwoniella bestiolae CBS 10118]OCF29469.1 hypothetical protein I302_00974 [Kwoniella bestiolae CBS 10118]
MDATAPPSKRHKAEPRPKSRLTASLVSGTRAEINGRHRISSSSSSSHEQPKVTSSIPLHTPPPAITLIKVIPPRDPSRTPTFEETNAEGKYAVYWMERAFRAKDTYNTLKRKTDVKVNELFREKAEEMSREKKGYEDQIAKSKMEMEEMKRCCKADKERLDRENTRLSEENRGLVGRNNILQAEKQKVEDEYKAHRYVANEDSKRARNRGEFKGKQGERDQSVRGIGGVR